MYDKDLRQSNPSIDDSLAPTVRLSPVSGHKGASDIPRDTPTSIIIDELSDIADSFFPIPKSGGFATMFGYVDDKGTRYCVKVLRKEHLSNWRTVKSFIREYEFLETLSASQAGEIVRPHRLIWVGGKPDALGMVLEYVPSATLLDVKFTLDAYEKIDAGKKLTRILGRVHKQGIIHNDIKPDNVFYQDRGGWPSMKLFDFGLARNIGQHSDHDPFVAEGTPLYMAPEVMVSSEYAGPQSDIYSLGAVLYELFVGHAPYSSPEECAQGPEVYDLFSRKAGGDIQGLGAKLLESTVPFHTGGVILNCLANDPRSRYGSVDDVLKEL